VEDPLNYTEVTERCPLDGGDVNNPGALAVIRQPKALVTSNDCYVVVIINIQVNRMGG
jgi:hypothetical protein